MIAPPPATPAWTRKCAGSSGFCHMSRALACPKRKAVYTAVRAARTPPSHPTQGGGDEPVSVTAKWAASTAP